MLAYGSVPEKIATVGASEEIFIQICAHIGLALMHRHGMSAEQAAFFPVHEEIRQRVTPIEVLYQPSEVVCILLVVLLVAALAGILLTLLVMQHKRHRHPSPSGNLA